MKFLCTALLLPALAAATILPEAVGTFQRGPASKPALADKALWVECGLKDSETAGYQNGEARFTLTAYQMLDSTGSMAAFEWQRPADGVASPLAKMAVQTSDGLLLVFGNYLLRWTGPQPVAADVDALTGALRNVDTTVLPLLPGYLPAAGRVPNSERYILGPVALQRFAPSIPPAVAAFHFGAEGQLAVFHNEKGDAPMVIFNYPTPQMAMLQIPAFQKLAGVVAKRSGPLVALVLAPPDPDYAERLLADVRYQAEITRDQYVPGRRDNIGTVVINAFVLIGILMVFMLISGLSLGGYRVLRRRSSHGEEPEALISLNLVSPSENK